MKVEFIVKLIHCLFNYRFISYFKKKRNRFYSIWISFEFKKVGKRSNFGRGLNLVGGQYIEIGNGSSIGKIGVLTAWDKYLDDKFTPQIKIGDNCTIGDLCHVSAINKIMIGNNVRMGKRVTILDNFHGNVSAKEIDTAPNRRKLYSKGPIIIKDNVWIGDNVVILPNVTIGYGAIIGASAVISKDVPQKCVVGGNPAKIIKFL